MLGFDGENVVSDNSTGATFTSVRGTDRSVCGLLESGNIICWGDDEYECFIAP